MSKGWSSPSNPCQWSTDDEIVALPGRHLKTPHKPLSAAWGAIAFFADPFGGGVIAEPEERSGGHDLKSNLAGKVEQSDSIDRTEAPLHRGSV